MCYTCDISHKKEVQLCLSALFSVIGTVLKILDHYCGVRWLNSLPPRVWIRSMWAITAVLTPSYTLFSKSWRGIPAHSLHCGVGLYARQEKRKYRRQPHHAAGGIETVPPRYAISRHNDWIEDTSRWCFSLFYRTLWERATIFYDRVLNSLYSLLSCGIMCLCEEITPFATSGCANASVGWWSYSAKVEHKWLRLYMIDKTTEKQP